MLETYRGPMQTVGNFITHWRISKGYSLIDLAEKTGVTKQYVSSVEHDKYEHPKEFILKLKQLMSKKDYMQLVEVSCANHKAGLI